MAAIGLDAGAAAEEVYPNRVIKIVVPFPPGGTSELVLRHLADRLASRLGQAVIIENRPGGAGGTVGAAAVARADPDGYTLLASSPGPLVTAATLYKNPGYDPIASFAPVGLLFTSPQLLAVGPTVPVTSIQELVSYAKAKPGEIHFASPGYGTQPHLLGEMFRMAAGIDIVHVPYKGPAQAVTDLLAGHVQLGFETSPLIVPQAIAGKLKILAIAGNRRNVRLPDIPTTAEGGFPELIGGFWFGILAPAGTPAGIITRLNGAIVEAMQAQEVELALSKLGAEATVGSPQGFAEFIAAERKKWSEVIRAAGIRVD
jgi:tripartite-type tricarboxylate transporter receptor subunit TctC